MSNANWNDYTLTTPQKRQDSSWNICYAYPGTEPDLPRVLMIGDSICNFYQPEVREKLAGKAALTYWATSMCVTDPLYLRELDLRLDQGEYPVITFNNGLHSLYTEKALYDEAYEKCVDFILAKCPKVKLYLVLTTPSKDEKLTEIVMKLNETAKRVAQARNLPVIDLYSLLEPLDRDEHWLDVYHHKPAAVAMQAEVMSEVMLSELKGE